MRNIITTISLLMFSLFTMAESVNIVTPKGAGNRVTYAAEYLQKKLRQQGLPLSSLPMAKKTRKRSTVLRLAWSLMPRLNLLRARNK